MENFEELINKISHVLLHSNLRVDNANMLSEVKECLKKYNTSNLSDSAKKFSEITNKMLHTHIAKDSDYGNSFEKSLDKFGLIASIVRIEDKVNRLESLLHKDPEVKESLQDTLLDLANYCIMTIMWIDKHEDSKV